MATLQKKTIVIVGGLSGIGFGVALAALQSLASIVIVASSNATRVKEAVGRLKAYKLRGEVRGEVLDACDSAAVQAFGAHLGAVDHIVWTSGDPPAGGSAYSYVNSAELGQGVGGLKPRPDVPRMSSVYTAMDRLARGLAVDLAPVRVNVVNPGAIDTELFDKMLTGDQKKAMFKLFREKTLLQRAGEPSEIAEAYLFLMKCGYITGQRIDVEGGYLLV